MKFFRRFLLVPAAVMVLICELFLLIGLILYVIGWPYGQRIQSRNDYNGLWDDNGPSLFYYILIIILTLVLMITLPLTLIPIWKGYVSRWSAAFAFPWAWWILWVLTNVLYGTIRFIPLNCSDNGYNVNYGYFPDNGNSTIYGYADYTKYCRGGKIIYAGTLILMFAAGITMGYIIWLLQEVLFQGTRKVHKRAKGRDAKVAVARGPVERVETVETTTTTY
eukprot:TRINITY_DN22566_c0_g1_i1.p1 TRINITY_DN22566_c0_g1~~TRINITY_DN22566_c0_g1_i1.p1  ORF type:complete len:221 (-),score=18.57 TRINITY_DN22566_c0_g1_i1:197-859(-)